MEPEQEELDLTGLNPEDGPPTYTQLNAFQKALHSSLQMVEQSTTELCRKHLKKLTYCGGGDG